MCRRILEAALFLGLAAGAEELSVPARTEHTCAYHVSKGSTLRWTFRVKDHDIGFAVRMRVQVWGGAQEEEAKSGVGWLDTGCGWVGNITSITCTNRLC